MSRPGLLDNASPTVQKVLVALFLVCMSGLFIAMCVTIPSEEILGGNTKGLVPGDQAWMLISTAIVILMTPGIAFFYGGMVQHKNLVATMMQVMIALAVIPILWSLIGFSLAFGESVPGNLFGNPASYGFMHHVGAGINPDLAPTIPISLFFLFQLAFAIITPTIIIGAVADRCNVSALMIFVALFHILIYCPLAHMVWHPEGIIRKLGVPDFAGGTVVHMSSGYAALAAAIYFGKGLKPPPGFEHTLEPANVPYVMLGTALLWFGWFGFNGGSALTSGPSASFAFLNTNAAAASAMITWMMMDILRGKKLRATGACIGAVLGLVAITPAAGFVNTGAAFLIGILGSVISSLVQEGMDRFGRRYVDDTLDVFACHGVGGTVGMILTSLFATTGVNPSGVDGAFYGNPLLLGKCLLVLVIIVPWFMTFTWGTLWVTDRIISVRVSLEEMLQGLDVSKHGERAYFTGDADLVITNPANGETITKRAAATVQAAPPV